MFSGLRKFNKVIKPSIAILILCISELAIGVDQSSIYQVNSEQTMADYVPKDYQAKIDQQFELQRLRQTLHVTAQELKEKMKQLQSRANPQQESKRD